jgi:hypothetical protein
MGRKKPRGRPPALTWNAEQLDRLEKGAGLGLTIEEIGILLGVCAKTIQRAMEDPAIKERYNKGYADAKEILIKRAYKQSETNPSMTMFILKCKHRWRETEHATEISPHDRAKLAREYMKKLQAGDAI